MPTATYCAMVLVGKSHKMKIFKYLRYSSDPQERGSSIERQTEIIDRFIATRPDFEVVATYIDDGYSASKGEHLAKGHFGRILADADTGKYRDHGMVVEKMDRFCRRFDDGEEHVRRLTKGGVELYLATSGRLVNPRDKDLGTIIQNVIDAWNAEDYVKNLTANVTRGWKSIMDKAADGRVLTRNVPTWLKVVDRTYNGAKIINPGRIIEVPEMVAIVQEIYRQAGQGVGSENIARLLGKRLLRPNGKNFTRSWIVKTLCNRAVLGEFELKNGEVIPGYFPQIISQSDFVAARQQMETKRKNGSYIGGNRKHSDTADDLLQGLVFDEDRKMYYHPVERGRYYYSVRDGVREGHRVRYDKVATEVVNRLEREHWLEIIGMSESAEYLSAKAEYESKLSMLNRTQRHIATMTEAMSGEDVQSVKVAMREIAKGEAVIETIQARLDELQAVMDAETKLSAELYRYKELIDLIREVKSDPTKRMLLRTKIKKIVSSVELTFTDKIRGVIRYVNGAKGEEFTIE